MSFRANFWCSRNWTLRGFQNIHNFMLVPDLKEGFQKKCTRKKDNPEKLFFLQIILFPENMDFWIQLFSVSLFLKYSFRSEIHIQFWVFVRPYYDTKADNEGKSIQCFGSGLLLLLQKCMSGLDLEKKVKVTALVIVTDRTKNQIGYQ